ncbi:hypothetical protein LCGC14_1140450, partial [marine sediment metagenome]
MRIRLLVSFLFISALSGTALAKTTAEDIRLASTSFLDAFARSQALNGYQVTF